MTKTYCKFFETEAQARQFSLSLFEAHRKITTVIEGPEDNWAVVDTETAADFVAAQEQCI